jgi:hypothetical protein
LQRLTDLNNYICISRLFAGHGCQSLARTFIMATAAFFLWL